MAFADDLLQQAYHLASKERRNPRQASLRRAVSTAYYALFHLLIDEVVSKWGVARQRGTLARTFEHGRMKRVCEECSRHLYASGSGGPGFELRNVTESFAELQALRHLADYDNALVWSREDATNAINTAAAAFKDWRTIRDSDAAQDFLLQLFLPKLR
jgi:hypothetical protein